MTVRDNRERIKSTFRHYMNLFMESSGFQVDDDNYAEWDEIIDGIIEQTKVEIIEELKAKI